ncbi:ESCRT-III subunit protein SNF7 KNAG_0A06105 [Huiozyma naganishii CBS 8797]|uniref:Vacuolar-sorting protein SNF7 n=1 Tax=Huiozyma naganishii (strain ATCC MYA-139 / BCRC 22969 / CBS 8797 / KCTC 17520 / NBRC 10181 / NCYC 3082 / Yp74L-3) TaxID=1071383 RepID=J7RFE2_HUIN7|nr:hypothetical protein KNAG_0A06105 [Kazachstania naganishii CBS 8797]CCK68273.1 hypothetical protein KNAG_0A06105 [Kazachstania naganishii CBS 8797]
MLLGAGSLLWGVWVDAAITSCVDTLHCTAAHCTVPAQWGPPHSFRRRYPVSPSPTSVFPSLSLSVFKLYCKRKCHLRTEKRAQEPRRTSATQTWPMSWFGFFGRGGRGGSGAGGGGSGGGELPQRAIIELREHINLLNKKRAHLEKQVGVQTGEARRAVQLKSDARAKVALRKRKLLQAQLDKLDRQVDSLEEQLVAIENANLNLETVRAMKQGAKAMKAIHNGIDIDRVDETMDEIREQVELGDEISDAISRPLNSGAAAEVDEDELDEELQQLVAEDSQHELLAEAPKPQPQQNIPLPSVPETTPQQKQQAVPAQQVEEDEDERALRELQEEMGL